ncbi:hypothetical protein AM499_04960 [Bacillus sp. FJAT-22090]|uniref:hypothetical protein n=1 Tax=Bacillus sp. FJAT-22090 TaxID=1581038 RepID=UPI0006AEBC47|nr:hypothetical protein [Bacillus sp. FJAT-22090]ALC85237.1 hypothetical protein AM499_04960 [Bacillus sp. FJAT-22090]
MIYPSTQYKHSEGSAFFKKAFSESFMLCNFIDMERFLIFIGVEEDTYLFTKGIIYNAMVNLILKLILGVIIIPCPDTHKSLKTFDVAKLDIPEFKLEMCLKEFELKHDFGSIKTKINLPGDRFDTDIDIPIGKVDLGKVSLDLPCLQKRKAEHKLQLNICYAKDMTCEVRKSIYSCMAEAAQKVANQINCTDNTDSGSFGKYTIDLLLEKTIPLVLEKLDYTFDHSIEHSEWENI